MSVRIQFDQPDAKCFTNLDFLTGRVLLILPTEATISAVNVKLEAESRTRLAGPRAPYNERSDKKRTELEVHKLLYKVLTVFPTPEIQQSSGSSQYTLLAGQYEYPFSFKFPFNNDCSRNTSLLRDLKVGQLNVQFAPDTNRHVKRTLPPSLRGFPGEAEIKYFVKATVVKPKFYQENLRQQIDIKFLPIEPPRPPNRHEETFARRKQQFQKHNAQPQRSKILKKSPAPDPTDEEPLEFQVDARLPSPAIITCNEPLPLRVLVQKLNDSSASVYLSMLQIELIGHTNVRAHDLTRTETGSWVLMSQANMNMPLHNPTDKSKREWKLPSRLWESIPLPNTVSPSFETCNISRKYELEVRVGLAHGMASGIRPELILLPLRLPVQVYSGIAPPPQLLRAMSTPNRAYSAPATRPGQQSDVYSHGSQSPDIPSTPIQENSTIPPQMGTFGDSELSEEPDEAPPSYEDAMADEIAPVDGPRREYSVPNDTEERPEAFNSDSKGKGLGRRVSERLFSQNSPSSPSRRSSGNRLGSWSRQDSDIESRQTLDEVDENGPPLPARTSTGP